jgi:hypothetical protein
LEKGLKKGLMKVFISVCLVLSLTTTSLPLSVDAKHNDESALKHQYWMPHQ